MEQRNIFMANEGSDYAVPDGYREAAGCIVMRPSDEAILLYVALNMKHLGTVCLNSVGQVRGR